ncbi:hypothetical protein RRG08_001225 [Elysia crispata]|uniref:Uncharacterized protein n=1 Tax=Elysia crispata TaxID=231223 RepID=A0AAE1B7F5_9GAST|nr:hypothetical protein RRG08_001225 [Elysia crispata]
MATNTRAGILQSVVREGLSSLPRLPCPQQTKDSSHPCHPCRRKRRLKKREFKSASVLTSGSNVTSPVERSINSASSVFPTSTPIDTPASSKPTSRSNSVRSR